MNLPVVNGAAKATLVAVVVSVSAAWALDTRDASNRSRESDRVNQRLEELQSQSTEIKESLARVESRLNLIIKDRRDE